MIGTANSVPPVIDLAKSSCCSSMALDPEYATAPGEDHPPPVLYALTTCID